MTVRVASLRRLAFKIFLLFALITAASSAADDEQHVASEPELVYETENQNVLQESRLKPSQVSSNSKTLPSEHSVFPTTNDALHELRDALSIMQDHYFSLWLGKWTTAIDWTAAVMSTYVSATLSSLSRSFDHKTSGTSEHSTDGHASENEINKYFAQTTASYYGEEAFAIRMQAYDDILWVVLEWLESIKFINSHSFIHHKASWHAQQFIPAFAHRARIFYQLAENGWDWHLCGGGMTWNPRLLPYKNAITNQLFISASMGMYLHFPGDDNCSPFLSAEDNSAILFTEPCSPGPYDAVFRQSAMDGYHWLKNSGMLNAAGLYTDGFHIGGYRTNKSATVCDERNEMVYTYNQGVILSGLRGLWEGTGNTSYLDDGYELIANVVAATGFGTHGNKWAGLGRNGILTEQCDLSGTCNQDGQTFKGIFFHHFTAFCQLLPSEPAKVGKTYAATPELAELHRRKCTAWTGWVVRNAKAAMGTRDRQGKFGAWWDAPRPSSFQGGSEGDAESNVQLPEGAVDYRNFPALVGELDIDEETRDVVLQEWHYTDAKPAVSGDLNDRGRGRTVETQGSGLAVVRAMYEFLKLEDH